MNIDKLVDELILCANLDTSYREEFKRIIFENINLSEQIKLPYNSERFVNLWLVLTQEKKWRNKSKNAIKLALKKLSQYNEQEAIDMLELAISGEYQAIHPINKKTSQNGKRFENNLTKQLSTSDGFGTFRD